ncbi:hypothetical protein BX070DRAFT_224433 [Coemansia spiralis]|nr:hypothetical protein BX070DRAFT_224433 [Coemansia spiralis]
MGCLPGYKDRIQLAQVRKDEYRCWQTVFRLHKLDPRRAGASRIFGTGMLLAIRSVLFAYTLAVWIVSVIEDVQNGVMKAHFVYFTYLCYTGLLAYLASSLFHTLQYWRRGEPTSFTQMPKTLQLLHWLLFESVVLYAVIVTALFWSLIYSPDNYTTQELKWTTASVHATNSVCVIVDMVIGSMVFSPHWSHPLLLCIVVTLYLALAYINYAVNGWFVYSFLDYKKHKAMEAAIIFGLLAGFLVVYYVVYVLQLLLDRFFSPKFNYARKSTEDVCTLVSNRSV